jgi:shikimate dehydrogenase
LIGFPLGHSFSRNYFTEKFEREGIPAEFRNFELPVVSQLPELIRQHPDLQGFSVTIPHKQAILPFLRRLSPEAGTIGAVNCVKVERQGNRIELYGYNTDAAGFRKSLEGFIPQSIKKALVLGNGGAAKAVCCVLDALGIEWTTVSRTPSGPGRIGYPQAGALLPHTPLIINATPLGTFPDTGQHPDLPYEQLTGNHYLFDLVYNPEKTRFLALGEKQGAHIRNGLEMLHGQAEAAWAIWNTPPGTK